MNTAQRIFKNTTALTLARLLFTLDSILTAWLIARILGPNGLGSYAIIMAWYATTAVWANLGISNFIPRDVSRDLSKTNLYMINLGVLGTAVTLVIVLALYLITPFFNYSSETTLGIYVVGLALVPTSLLYILEAVIVTHERLEFMAYSQLVAITGDILATIYLLSNGYGVVAIVISYVVSRYVILGLNSFFLVRYIVKPRWEFDFSFLRNLVKDLKDFTLLGIFGGLFDQTEVLILSLLIVGNDDVGYYTAALKLITVWYVLPQSFMGVVFPILSRSFEQSTDKFKLIQAKAVKYLMALAFPLGIGLVILGSQIIDIFYGADFEKSVPVLQILAWMPILIFLSGVLWRTLLARNEQHLALRVLMISLVIRVITTYVFVSWLGYLGAAVALASTYACYVLLHAYYVWKGGTPIPFFQITWRLMVASLLMGAFTWVLNNVLYWPLSVIVPFSALVYVTLVLLLQGFAKDDIELFRSIIRRRSKVPV